MSAAPAWTAAGLLGVAIVLASGRLGGSAPSMPASDSAWKQTSAPQAVPDQPAYGDARCPAGVPAAPRPANHGA